MIVVADSGPLQYLILVAQVDLLHRFYGDVLVPGAVASELLAARAPQAVRDWMSRPPSWIEIVDVSAEEVAQVPKSLDLGERAAIALADRLKADVLLIDEAEGRAEAMRRHLRVTGTLGILRVAAQEGLIDVRDVVVRLRATTFYVDEDLLDRIFGTWVRP
jgi:predicted nucleic acid-binding protein